MALQTSGPISMDDICDEFNVPRNTPLMSFYRGDGIVPNISANSGVPTSGPISILDFYGASNIEQTVVFSGPTNYTVPVGSGATVIQVGLMATTDGQILAGRTQVSSTGTSSTAYFDFGARWIPSGASFTSGDYEVRFVLYMGNWTSWSRLDSNRSYLVNQTSALMSAEVRRRNEHQDSAMRSYTISS